MPSHQAAEDMELYTNSKLYDLVPRPSPTQFIHIQSGNSKVTYVAEYRAGDGLGTRLQTLMGYNIQPTSLHATHAIAIPFVCADYIASSNYITKTS